MKPTVLPLSVSRRGAGRPTGGAVPGVGSRTRKVMTLLLLLGRLAVDAHADRQGDRMALVAEPGRYHRAEAAGRTARGDDQQLVGRFHRGVDAVTAVAHDGAFADIG